MDIKFEEELEKFELIVNTNTSSISARDLIKYVANTEALIKNLNYELNRKYATGYDQVCLEIEALEKGSFKIISVLKKLSENPTASIVLGGIILKFLTNDPSSTVVNIYNSDVTINTTELLENRNIIRSRSNIAKTLCEDNNAESLTIKIHGDEEYPKEIRIEKEVLQGIIISDEPMDEKQSHLMKNIQLVIVSPVLESEPASWKVKLISDRKISARMTDEDFLKLMSDNPNIAFGKGDKIIADLESIVTKKENGKETVQHFIRKVHSYPKYKNAERGKELDLFESKE